MIMSLFNLPFICCAKAIWSFGKLSCYIFYTISLNIMFSLWDWITCIHYPPNIKFSQLRNMSHRNFNCFFLSVSMCVLVLSIFLKILSFLKCSCLCIFSITYQDISVAFPNQYANTDSRSILELKQCQIRSVL